MCSRLCCSRLFERFQVKANQYSIILVGVIDMRKIGLRVVVNETMISLARIVRLHIGETNVIETLG